MEENRQQFINATLMVMGFFALAAFVTGEMILLFVGLLPPFLYWVFNGGSLGMNSSSTANKGTQRQQFFDQMLNGQQPPADAEGQSTSSPVVMQAPARPAPVDPDQVIANTTALIENNSKDAHAYLERGSAYFSKGNYNDALLDLNMALYYDPRLPKAHILRGNILLMREDYGGALQEFNRALQISPDMARAYHSRSYAQALIGDINKAIDDGTRAIELDPTFYLAYGSRGHAFFLKGDYISALADFEKSLQFDPDYDFSLAGVAITKHAMGETEEATEKWQKLVEKDPAYADANVLKTEAYAADAFVEEAQKLASAPDTV